MSFKDGHYNWIFIAMSFDVFLREVRLGALLLFTTPPSSFLCSISNPHFVYSESAVSQQHDKQPHPGVNKKHQKFIFEYRVFSQKTYYWEKYVVVKVDRTIFHGLVGLQAWE